MVGRKLFFVTRGVLAVWKGFFGPAEKRERLATLSTNDFFGESSLTAGSVTNSSTPKGTPRRSSINFSTDSSTSGPKEGSSTAAGKGAAATVECLSYCELLEVHHSMLERFTTGGDVSITTAIAQGVQERVTRQELKREETRKLRGEHTKAWPSPRHNSIDGESQAGASMQALRFAAKLRAGVKRNSAGRLSLTGLGGRGRVVPSSSEQPENAD